MSKNKQSSVEFLEQKFISIFVNDEGFKKAIEQAKAMHKEECKESYYESLLSNFQTFEHYYNETFGGNNENN